MAKTMSAITVVALLGLVACHHSEIQASKGSEPTASAPSAGTNIALRSASPAEHSIAEPAASSSKARRLPAVRNDEAWVLVEEENVTIPVIDELGEYLLAANRALGSQKNADAVSDLHKAGEYLESLSTADPKGTARLTAAAKELDSLAGEVAKGKVTPKQLKQAYQQAFDADVAVQWVAVEIEDTWQAYSRRPGEHLDRATQELKANPKAAALDIREANSYLRVEQLKHPNDLLKAAVSELDALADDVQAGKVKDSSRIDDAIEDSGHALAWTNYHQAVDAWQRHDRTLASRQLKQAVGHLTLAARRAETKIKADVEELHRSVEAASRDVGSDINALLSRVGARLDQLKAAIDKRRGH